MTEKKETKKVESAHKSTENKVAVTKAEGFSVRGSILTGTVVSAKAPKYSPDASLGSHLCFCFSVA